MAVLVEHQIFCLGCELWGYNGTNSLVQWFQQKALANRLTEKSDNKQ